MTDQPETPETPQSPLVVPADATSLPTPAESASPSPVPSADTPAASNEAVVANPTVAAAVTPSGAVATTDTVGADGADALSQEADRVVNQAEIVALAEKHSFLQKLHLFVNKAEDDFMRLADFPIAEARDFLAWLAAKGI